MYSETVVFTGHKAISGQGAKGPWSKSIFTDQQGREFGVWTNNAEGAAIASQLLPLLNQSVTVEFETSQRGKFTNYDIKSVTPANGSAPAAAAPQAAPAPVVQQAPPPQGYESDDDRQLRIMRQSALERAIMSFGSDQVEILTNLDALFELSDQYVVYFTQGREAVGVVVEEQAVAGPVA